MSVQSYDEIHELYAWRDNNRTFTVTTGEGGIKYLLFLLKDKQGAIDLEESGAEVYYAVTRPNNTPVLIKGKINTLDKGVVKFIIEPSLTAVAGLAKGEVRVISESQGENGVLKFYGANLNVLKGTSDEAIENSGEFSALIEALAKVKEINTDGNFVEMGTEIKSGETKPVSADIIYNYLSQNYADIIKSGRGAPTESTKGKIKQLYYDVDNKMLYICVKTGIAPQWEKINFTDEQIATALEAYLKENPIEGTGLTDFIRNTDIDYAFDSTTNANYTIIRIYKNKIDGTKQYPFVYAPNGVNSGTMTTYDLAIAEGWLFAINAGVFDTSNCKPDGIIIQNGEVLQNSPTVTHSQCKPLTIDSNGNLGYADYNANADDLVSNGIVSAVTGFIPIIVDYVEVPSAEWNDVSHYTDNAQRQIIGQFGNGDYAIITCEGRNFDNSDGWTIVEAQAICKKHGLKFAYNLDGGGSTETMLGKKHINTIYEGTTGRKVPTFIVFNGKSVFDGKVPDEPEGKLPSGYTELSYVSAPNGGVYIDTGIPATADYDAEYKFQQGGQHILSANDFYYPFFKVIGDSRVMTINRFGNDFNVDYLFSFNNDYVIKVTGETVLVNDVVVTTERTKGDSTPTGNLYLFAYGGNPAVTNYQFEGKLYYMKLFDKTTGEMVREFIPCKNASGVIGLYDTITGVFYDSDTETPFEGA